MEKTAPKTASNFKNKSSFKDSGFDPNGSYTGTAVDGGKPVQDADDL